MRRADRRARLRYRCARARRARAGQPRARYHDGDHHPQRADRRDGPARDHARRRADRADRGEPVAAVGQGAALGSALDRKLGRGLWRLKGQVATIALVLACGIMAMVMLRSTWQSLLGARDAYYQQYRFGDVFARLERAPEAVLPRLERLPAGAPGHLRAAPGRGGAGAGGPGP